MADAVPSSAPAAATGLGTSYPSPVSTAGSPNMEETSRQPISDPSAQRSDSQQQSLRAASAALQAAYRRIRQVRRSLGELMAEPLPSPESVAGIMGPNHSALVLTASPVEESSDANDVIDFQRLRSNLAEVDRQTQEYLDRFAPGSWSDHQQVSSAAVLPRTRSHMQLPSPSPSSSEPLHHLTIPRRSMLESQLTRRREVLNPDDATTFIGRRVAAREAAGTSRPLDTPPSSHMDPSLRAAEMERELLYLRTPTRRTDPGMVATARADALSRSELVRAARSLDMDIIRAGQRQQPTNAPSHPWQPRRWRTYRAAAETRANSSTQSPQASLPPHPDRLSLLSNFSVQNFSTPTSALPRDRPLLFEEPLSYVNGQRRDSRDADSPGGSERSYFIHRRLNADGDELVHNINLEWDDDDPLSWLIPSREHSMNENPDFYRRRVASSDPHDRSDSGRGARGPLPLEPIPEPRRRGWARLDLDGNPIPSDEEEELERSRAEYRIRALYQARASAAAASSRVEWSAQSSNDMPVHSHHDVGAFSNLITRTSVASLDTSYGSAVPYVVDPLPIPLSEMVLSKNDRNHRAAAVRVSRHAGLGGR
ncbi:hypothetical protein GGX14DRAFT_350210 [Mycena pura]|uniref:Uncharacterized protein n=1 Tax=Mycena pura TaxID=153505 RepID=A0AAD6YQ95_9AGAR|nr:hypothetical protein GGX14DRAFT_350210 [Mycena pura]